jgi:hypothetical protein
MTDTRTQDLNVSLCPQCGGPLDEIAFVVELRAPAQASGGMASAVPADSCNRHGAAAKDGALFEQNATPCCPHCCAPRQDMRWSRA